jgi:hypothetical protein
MVHRLRTRDLFAFAGEIILSAERRSQLQLGGDGATAQIKRQLLGLLRERDAHLAAAREDAAESKQETAPTGENMFRSMRDTPLALPSLLYAVVLLHLRSCSRQDRRMRRVL